MVVQITLYNSLRKQFVNHDICGGGAPGMIYITYSNFVVITIRCFLATIDRRNIMATIHRESMMVNGSM